MAVTLALGDSHSACTTEEGTLYTWGHGMDGKLGHGDESSKSVPTRVEALAGQVVVQLVAAGSWCLPLSLHH